MNHKLYVLEGVDGVGKTEVGNEFRQMINGADIPLGFKRFLKEKLRISPQATFYDKERAYFKYIESKLPALMERQDVVLARYAYTGLAVNYCRTGQLQQLPDWVTKPDQIIYLTASWEELEKRFQKRELAGMPRKNHENSFFLQKLAQVYELLFLGNDKVIRIDTTERKPDDVAIELYTKLELKI